VSHFKLKFKTVAEKTAKNFGATFYRTLIITKCKMWSWLIKRTKSTYFLNLLEV